MKLGTIKSPSEFPQAAMKVFKDLGNHSFKKTDTPATVLGLLVKGFTNAGINGGPTPGLTDETSKAGHALAINIYGASNDINPNNRDECCEAVIATLGFNFQRKFMEKINALSYHKLKKEDFQQVGGDSGVVDPDKFQTDIDEAFEGENGVFWLGKNKIVEEDILVSALRKLYHQTEIAGIPNRTVVPRMGEKKGSVESFEFAKGETALEKYVALGELFLSYSCSHCKDGEGRASGDIADQTQLTMVRKTLNAIIAKDPDGQKTSTLIAIKNVLLAAHNKVKPNILVAEGLKLVDVFMTGSLQKASRKGLAKTTNGKHLSKLAHAFLKILDGPALSIDINKLSDPAYIKSTSTEVMTRLIAMAEWAEYNSDELDENIETNANIASMFSIAAAIIQPFCVSEETEEPQVSSAKNNSYHAGNYGGESTQQPTLNSETSWTKFGDDSNGHPIYYKTGDSETLQALTQGDYRSLKMCGNGTHCCAVQFAKDGVKSFFSGSCKNGVCVICAGSHSAAYCRDASKVERLNAAKVCMDLKPVFERSVLQAIENQGNGGSPKKQGGGFRGSNSNGQKDSPTKQDKKIAIEKAFKSSIGAGGFSNVPATKKNIGLFRKVMNDTFSPKKHKPEEKEKETSAAVAFKAVRAVKDRSTASFNAVRTVINNPSAAAFKAIRAVTAMFKQQKKGVDGTIDFTKDTALCYLRLRKSDPWINEPCLYGEGSNYWLLRASSQETGD
jgi:hypothetical protein